MSLGVNIQWGYAGLFNSGIMGFAALGGVAVVLVSMPPVPGALSAGGAEPRPRRALHRRHHRRRALRPRARARLPARRRSGSLTVAVGYFLMRIFLDPASPGDRGDRPGRRRLPRRPRPARADRLGGRRPLRRRRRLPRRQGRARPALRLPRDRHPRHRRDHPRDPEERELADPRRQERHRPAAPAPRRARAAGRALDRTTSPPRFGVDVPTAAADRLPPRLCGDLHRRAPRHPLALRAGAALALGPDDAGDPRQPRRRRGDGQGRHRAATCRSSSSARRSSASPGRCWSPSTASSPRAATTRCATPS